MEIPCIGRQKKSAKGAFLIEKTKICVFPGAQGEEAVWFDSISSVDMIAYQEMI